MLQEKFFIGIDIGTSITKGVLISVNGDLISEYHLGHQYTNDKDYSCIWWEEVCDIIKKLTENIDKNNIESITLSAMVPNLVMINKKGAIVAPTILFTDDFAIEMQDCLDRMDNSKWKNETLSKLIVLRKKLSQWDNISYILTTHCYIGYKLTGMIYCDLSSAYEYGNVFDEKKKTWADEILMKYNIRADILPPIVKSLSVVGTLCDEVAQQLNLPNTIKVIAGTHDSIASIIGAGLMHKNDHLIYYGTFNSSAIIKDEVDHILSGKIASNPIEWTSSIPGAGPQINQLCHILCNGKYDEFEEEALNSIPGAGGVLFLQNPNLLSTSISSDTDGWFCHITSNTKRCDLCRAVYEAFPYGIKAFWDSLSGFLYPSMAFAAGGGARSVARLKITSDILHITQYKVENSENAFGTALIGIAAYKVEQFNEIQAKRIRAATKYMPNDKNTIYDLRFREYKQLLQSRQENKIV